MRQYTRFIVVTIALFVTGFFAHSCFRQKDSDGNSIPKIDRAELCRDGGASVNETTNECECPAGLAWTGVRCDTLAQDTSKNAAQPVTKPKPVAEPAIKMPEEKPAADDKEVELSADVVRRSQPKTAVKPKEEPTAVEVKKSGTDSVPVWLPQLQRACRIAGGSWLARQLYCHCPDGKVLMGRRCRFTGGRMTDDVCLRAVVPGAWRSGVCECPDGLVFSPGRGGCVDPFQGDSTILRRICESTVNQGKWNEAKRTCVCPEGKFLHGETCVAKTNLRSEDICESTVVGGKWNSTNKTCNCPDDRLWVNQACLTRLEVEPEDGCASDESRGRWNKARQACDCPRGKRWSAVNKSCR